MKHHCLYKLFFSAVLVCSTIGYLPAVQIQNNFIQNNSSIDSGDIADDDNDIESEDYADIDDISTRLNPVIDVEDDEIDIPIPSIIRLNDNYINFNGASWDNVKKAVKASNSKPFSIVTIGDSHVQADIGTGTVRELIQYDLGNAGRGMIAPLKMSGTNEPRDYIFSSTNTWNSTKLMSSRWENIMGFTGTSIKYTRETGDLTIGTSERDDYNPFSSLIIFHSGKMEVTKVTDNANNDLEFRAIPSRDYTQIILSSSTTCVKLFFKATGDLTVFGASLSGERPGVFFHAIGNNGATYETYNRIGTVGAGIAPLNPELVIITLGTNEAFGSISPESFYRSIDRLVSNILGDNPDAKILLVTPMECHKSIYTTVKKTIKVPVRQKKTKKGKSKKTGAYTTKTVSTRVRSYGVNTSVKPLRDVILKYGKDKGIAVYDWYNVAGGEGASDRWISEGLFSKDRVHHSYKGYHLQGRLLYEALMNAISE